MVKISIKSIYDRIEEETYDLVNEVEYGDLTNIDTNWSTLKKALDELINYLLISYEATSIPSVADILSLLPLTDFDKVGELIDVASLMQSKCDGSGSTGTLDHDDINDVQGYASDFERLMVAMLDHYREKDE